MPRVLQEASEKAHFYPRCLFLEPYRVLGKEAEADLQIAEVFLG